LAKNLQPSIEKGPERGRRQIGQFCFAVFALWVVNFETFRKHYQGKSTFPWDFLGGYHAQAFGWYDLGNMASPPAWFPWTNLGFPAYLAIQSGGWYLPLALMHAVGIVYTVHAATIVQVLHVLFGALGALLLLRRLGAGLLLSLMAALAYHYTAAFFSNQQHVDIVRAAAWFPWLLLAFHPKSLTSGWWKPLAASFVLSQLLISGYPGAIVAFAYACFSWTLLLCFQEKKPDRWRFAMLVGASVAGGVLMAMPKWFPFLLNGTADITLESFQALPADNASLFTLLLPYDTPALHGDLTMRSLWLPLVGLWGLVFASPKCQVVKLGMALLALGLVFCFLVPHVPALVRWLPGMSLSRFPLADWRPVINMGLLLISVAGWRDFITRDFSATQVGVRNTAALSLFLMAMIGAIHFGYEAPLLARALGFAAIIALITVLGHACMVYWPGNQWSKVGVVLLLAIAAAIQGYWYQRAQPTTWRPVWNKDVEVQSFGGRFKDFMKERHPEVMTARRPARMLMGATPEQMVGWHDNSHYNRCWYMHTYCVFGYDNLRMSAPHAKLLAEAALPGGQALLHFVARPQQLLIVREGEGDRIPNLIEGDAEAAVGDAHDVSVKFVLYGPGFTTYEIKTPRPLTVVENEIGWHGWEFSRCDDRGRCTSPEPVAMTSQALRTWRVPKGRWTVNLRFVGPSNAPGYACFFTGLLLAMVVGGGARRLRSLRT
jgi:hypothetical protein